MTTIIGASVVQTEREIGKEVLLRQMARFAFNLSRADSILTGTDLKVEFVDQYNVPAPSYTDGETIWFNIAAMRMTKPMDDGDIIRVNGLNYHELAHVIYTPRQHTSWGQFIMNNRKYHAVANILEDARIERFLIAMYPSVQGYLHAVVLKYILDQPQHQLAAAHLLLHGRRYMPQDIRDGVKDLWAHGDRIRKAIEVQIDRYIEIPDVAESRIAKTCIKKIWELMNEANAQTPPSPYGHDANSNSVAPEQGEHDSEQAEEAADWADFNEEEEGDDDEGEGTENRANAYTDTDDDAEENDDDDDADGSSAGGDDDTEGEDGDGETGSGSGDDDEMDGEDEGGSGSSAGDDEGDDSDADSDGTGGGDDDGADADSPDSDGSGDSIDPSSSAGGGAGTQEAKPQTPEQKVKDDIAKAIKDIAQSHNIKEEVREQGQYINIDDGTIIPLPVANYGFDPITPDMRLVSERFAEVLMQMRTDSDPGWETSQSSGRINMRRAMQSDDIDTVWDRWDSDKQDSTRIAAALCIDSSGSMHGRIGLACEAAWAIKQAIEKIDGTCSVANYSHLGTLMYGPQERVAQ